MSCSVFSWMSGTWSSSWLAVKPCSQKTHQCGSKIWRDTSTSIWPRQKRSPHSAAMLTVRHTKTEREKYWTFNVAFYSFLLFSWFPAAFYIVFVYLDPNELPYCSGGTSMVSHLMSEEMITFLMTDNMMLIMFRENNQWHCITPNDHKSCLYLTFYDAGCKSRNDYKTLNMLHDSTGRYYKFV